MGAVKNDVAEIKQLLSSNIASVVTPNTEPTPPPPPPLEVFQPLIIVPFPKAMMPKSGITHITMEMILLILINISVKDPL